MEYRLKKQITIAAAFFAAVFLIFLAFFFSGGQAPSCFDGKLNQEEERVDCGGPHCAPCAALYMENIQVVSADFLLFDGRYDAFAVVKNPNSQYGASDLKYRFKFYDKDDQFISEISGKSFISAGEAKYIALSNIDLAAAPASVKIEFDPVIWKEQMRTNIKLPIFSKKYENTSGLGVIGVSQVSGVIENQSNYSFSDVGLFAALLDKDGKYIAVNQTKINNLRSGERRDIVIPWFSEIKNSADVAKVVVEASANVIDDSNILR
ncbi:hypothetical protein HY249_03285 [Candidatus Azambacteria bacterium]|nr:hypothetical protein [Candidatus Azambacteria bacterium]